MASLTVFLLAAYALDAIVYYNDVVVAHRFDWYLTQAAEAWAAAVAVSIIAFRSLAHWMHDVFGKVRLWSDP